MKEEIWMDRAELLRPFSGIGMTHGEIAERVGLTIATVRTYQRRFGFDFGRNGDLRQCDEAFALQIEAIKACADEGMTRQEASDKLGLSFQTLSRYSREYAIAFRHGLADARAAARVEAMASMYRSGKTLNQIGQIYGITRERVRQLLRQHSDVTAEEGGAAKVCKERRERRRREREAACLAEKGCTLKQYRQLQKIGRDFIASGGTRERSPIGAFICQRSNARVRGIGWTLTLWDWWTIWQESGHWVERGRERGQYVMCRFGDAGAYEAGNVYIATTSHNLSVQPNNKYRASHPEHEAFMAEMRAA